MCKVYGWYEDAVKLYLVPQSLLHPFSYVR